MPRVTINSRATLAPAGATVLDAARLAGIEVPTLCQDNRLRPAGACRLCLVQVRGIEHPVPACATPVDDGMAVETHTLEIEETRRMLLQMLAEDYPADAASLWPEKPFHRWLRHYSISLAIKPPKLSSPIISHQSSINLDFGAANSATARYRDASHPYLLADLSRCIDCFRCVRICNEVQGQFVWHVTGRGNDARVVPDGPTLLGSSCVSCGACVDTCPTGALEDQSVVQRGEPTAWTRTTCPYCGVGCEMNVGTRDGRIVQVTPTLEAPVNKGHLCVKGRYAFDFNHAADRITEPLIREDVLEAFRASRTAGTPISLTPTLSLGERESRSPPLVISDSQINLGISGIARGRRMVPPLPEGEGWGEGKADPGRSGWCVVSWAEAIDFVAMNLRRILDQSGPDSIGVLGSARGTNEENYLAQKFARVVLGTNNVDCCARVCHAPTAAGMKQTLGTGAATNSFDDIEHAAAILICGCNPTENHPVVGARIKQAVLRGARLIVMDPREIELAHLAGVHLPLRPGTNVPVLHALAHVIVFEGLADSAALRDRVSGFDSYRDFLAGWTPERAAGLSGVDPESLRRAARLYATCKPAMCFHGLGVTEHVQGTDAVMCLVNLALLTGNLGRPGAGVNPLRGQNNVQGSAHMGCEPGNLTGYVPLDQGRERFEAVWGTPVPRAPGLNLMQMMDAAGEGKLKALWAIGYDVALTNPNAVATRTALSALDFIVVQDLFLNELAREFGHVFLPACSSFEKDGTFMNSERRVQRVRKALEPAGHSRPDAEILGDVAKAMGFATQFNFRSAEQIWNEVRTVWKAGAGISYPRLEAGGLQWPCPAEDHPGTRILHVDGFPHGPRAPLQCVEFAATAETLNLEFPFLLTTGRTLYQFNAGTMTMRTPNVRLRGADTLDINPADAVRLGLTDGDCVRVRSRHGEAVMPLRVDLRVKPGELFATFHAAEVFLNNLTGPNRDRFVQTPEYKVVAVSLERVPTATEESVAVGATRG